MSKVNSVTPLIPSDLQKKLGRPIFLKEIKNGLGWKIDPSSIQEVQDRLDLKINYAEILEAASLENYSSQYQDTAKTDVLLTFSFDERTKACFRRKFLNFLKPFKTSVFGDEFFNRLIVEQYADF